MKKIIIIILSFIVFFLPLRIVYAVNTSAESYVLMDMDSNRVLDEKDKDKRMLTASIAKIMTLLVAIKYGDLNEYVTITREDLNQEGSKAYIDVNEEVKLEDLLYALILRSGNDAANAIARAVGGNVSNFVYLMNEEAKEIGMKNTTFENPSGLDSSSKNYSTAYDMALLTSYAYNFPEFRKFFEATNYTVTSKSGKTYPFEGKHRLVNQKGIYLGGKTGFTKAARRTLVTTAKKDGVRLVVVTLNDPNDWEDHERLFEYGFSSYTNKTILKAQVLKQNELMLDYLVALKHDIILPLKEGEEVKLEFYIKENPDVDAGYVLIYVDDELVKKEALYPKNTKL